MRVRHADEEGAVAVIVALSIVALIGMIVLVVDVGTLLVSKRKMVRAADAAALAGAVSCAQSQAFEMQSKADEFADANKSGAVNTSTTVDPAGSCGTAPGEISVAYSTPEEMIFAPVLGFPETVDVETSSTAMWGPSSEVIALPIMISRGAFERCGFDISQGPVSGEEQQCGIWYDDDDIGNAQWGFLNFDLWDVDGNAHCNNSGSASKTWIVEGQKKKTNFPDDTTYVCADPGLVASDWAILDGEAGKIKYFPIADGQVDGSGDPATGSFDKYNIVGFAGLRIVSATKKEGSPTVSGTCSTTLATSPGQMIPQAQASDAGCPSGNPEAVIGQPTVMIGTDPAVLGTDYTYEPTTNIVTWTGEKQPNVSIEFTWTDPGSTVTCGGVPKNSSSVCLVVSWPGARLGGGNPTINGMDFGLRSVRLLNQAP